MAQATAALTQAERQDIELLIGEDLADPCVVEFVREYFRPSGRFAGASFLELGVDGGDPNVIDCSDLLAVSLLDTPFSPLAVRQALGEVDDYHRSLTQILSTDLQSTDLDLWDAEELHLAAANEAWSTIRRFDHVGPTRAGKLLARKRPRLIPIADKIVVDRLKPVVGKRRIWIGVQGGIRKHLAALPTIRVDAGLDESTPLLRLLDVCIWMRHSKAAAPTRDAIHASRPR